MKLTMKQKENIKRAIKKAESKTSGEVVTVIAQKSDRYLFVSLFWAMLLAFLIPVLALSLGVDLKLTHLLFAQMALFLLLFLVLDKTSINHYLVPKNIAHARAKQKAQEQFLARGVHLTENHTGVLLFVSVAEHYVEILADTGISKVVPQEKWDSTVANFINKVKAKEFEQGFIEAIDSCGALLETYIPQLKNDLNELADGLVEIE